MYQNYQNIKNDNSIIIETLSGKLKFERSAVSLDYSKKLNSTENK